MISHEKNTYADDRDLCRRKRLPDQYIQHQHQSGPDCDQRDQRRHGGAGDARCKIRAEISESLFHLTPEQWKNIVIAYEPIWAIGTGKTATSDQAQEVHAFIRSLIAQKFDNNVADNTTILYGGSCKPSNAAELFAKPDIDGGLIGGASLKAQDFMGIVTAF